MFIKIGNDYVKCSLCGFVKEKYVHEHKVAKYILNFMKSETKDKKIANSGKHRRNASGFHTIDPFLGNRSKTRDYYGCVRGKN